MYLEQRCRLSVIFTIAAILAFSLTLSAQGTTPELVSASATSTATILPSAQPAPEALGDALMGHRRYQAAIEAYKQGSPESPTIWNKMGIAYQMMFNLQDALRCYQESLKIDAKSVNVLNNLGTVYDSMKQYKLAVKMYRKALKIDPKSALVLKNLGTDLLAQHQYKKGWEIYKQALTVDPQIFDRNNGPRIENPASVQERGAMNFYMAKGCVRAGRNDRAVEYLRMAINEGFTNAKKVEADQEFAGLHGLAAFDLLMAEQKTQ
ncbi:MAG TPA: tetratricopeptide repeat protein [Terracidiphilus sp.]|jgi:tetratricopeptide (TPR) repeat protein|nr:tetratricopeptide repeat protein [Terracidiphilus sp.]